MATSVSVSAIYPLPLDFVWNQLRDFTFPERLLCSTISKVELEQDADAKYQKDGTSIGVVRKVHWKSGEWRRHRLLEVSDQFQCSRWEIIEAFPETEVTAEVNKLKCSRISELNYTLVEWSSEYSSDASAQFLSFQRRAHEDNLIEIRCKLTGVELPILYHIPEAPSTRVIWICSELGIPIRLKDATPSSTPSLRKSSGSIPTAQGGLVTSFVEGDTTILESGAIVFYLLEKHDLTRKLSPAIGTPERGQFLKFFFHISSTLDNIVFDAYKHLYVLEEEEGMSNQRLADNLKQNFDKLMPEFEYQLKKHEFICGNQFSACDVMAGWTLYVANLLGWLDSYPLLKQYFDRLSKRRAFQKAFSSF